MGSMILRPFLRAVAVVAAVFLPAPASAQAPDLPVEILYRAVDSGSDTLTYTMAVPRLPPPRTGYPLVLALHYSMGPSGAPTYFGLGFAGQLILPALLELNAVIVIPDAPTGTWAHPRSERLVLAMLDEVQKDFAIDARRTMVTGFSMGGNGAWYFAAKHPERFRAAVPISSSPLVQAVETQKEEWASVEQALADPGSAWASQFGAVPLYVIHSQGDELLPFEQVERAVETLKKRGVAATLAPVEGIPHHQLPSYVEPLRDAIPWIREAWARK
jgi:predicted peptidase